MERAGTRITVDTVSGTLDTFLVEPFVPHAQDTEHYVCIQSVRDGDLLYFCRDGGIDVGDVDAKARKLLIPTGTDFDEMHKDTEALLLQDVPADKRAVLTKFVQTLVKAYVHLNFSYLEINPLVVLPHGQAVYLDLAAKLDQTAEFESGKFWSQALGGRQL